MANTPTKEQIQAVKEMAEANAALAKSLRDLQAAYSKEGVEKLKKVQDEYTKAALAAGSAVDKQSASFKAQQEVLKQSNRQLDKINEVNKKSKDGFAALSVDLKTVTQLGGELGPVLLAGVATGMGGFDKLSAPLREIEINAIKTFGSLDSESSKLFVRNQKLLRNMVADQATGQMAVDARLKTLSIDPAKAQQEIIKEQNDIQGAVAQNLDRFKKELTDPEIILNLRGLRSALGLSAEETAIFADRAAAFGTSIQGQMAVAAKATSKYAKSSGVDFSIIKKGQNALRKNMKSFATFSESQLARVAAASAKTGVSLATMGGGLVDSFDDFDSAAEKAAMLGQSFGISIDAFELFATEDPTERLQMIQEAASRAGVDIANMGRRELNYLSELTGMGVEDTMKALGQGGLEVAGEVAGLEKAGDLQSQVVAANQENSESVQALTDQMKKLIPVMAEKGQAVMAGMTMRAVRSAAGVTGEAEQKLGEGIRDLLTGGQKAMRKTVPGGMMGVVAEAQTKPAYTALQSQVTKKLERGMPEKIDNAVNTFDQFIDMLADPTFRKEQIEKLDSAKKWTAEKAKKLATVAKVKNVAKDLADEAKEKLGLGGQGSMEGDVALTGESNAALRGGRAGTATQGPINLVVNVSLPVDGDAIASAAYSGQIRPGVTGEQALQAAAANENPAGE